MMARLSMFLRAVATALFLIVVLPGGASAGPSDEAKGFIESLADQAIQALTLPDISKPERVRRFRILFNDHFAVEDIGKWVLGRYWRRAEPAERDEYLILFEDYIVVSYVDRFAEYAGEKLQITKVIVETDGSAEVYSEVLLPGGGKTPVRVNWRVDGADGDFKIVDLVIEGVSMSATLRSDFSSILRRNGGKMAGLLDILREKTASLKGSQ
jgi:phospholipid transport system substrate-binding protein